MMKRAIQLALVCAAILIVAAGQAQAGMLWNNSGLANPAQTITFDEIPSVQFDSITNQYESLGVTFSPNLVFNSQMGNFPNINGDRLGNFNPVRDPFTISFTTPQTEAAFAMVTNLGISRFTALLDGEVVESFYAVTSTRPFLGYNYFGFTGITFDAIRVNVGGFGNAMLLDNVQLGTIAHMPEASSLVAWGIVAAGMTLFVARRRKQAVAA